MRYAWLVLLGLLLSSPAHAQEEILFVFGSDTSTPGIRLDRFGAVYPATGFDMFADPARQGYRIMDPALRARHRDSYGTPIKMTWWMQGGSLYRHAENTNVPLASTMSTHLMYRYHREAVEQLGDEMSFHFHTWVWTDYDGDRRYFWNQAKSFSESREDFDLALAEHLIQEDLFPASFRSGWHYMDDLWQARLDELLPFSLHNASPSVRTETVEPIDNVFDWGEATLDYVPYQPSPDDYQLPGGSRGWNTRSRHLSHVSESAIRQIFEDARAGKRQVACLWSHLAESDFVEQVETVASTIARVAEDYPDVPFRYATAVEAMQRWLGTPDRTPPAIDVEEIPAAGGVVLRVTSDEPLFQPAPFVASLDRFERYRVLDVVPAGPLAWETSAPLDPAHAAHVAVAAIDTSGNLATRHVRYLPDDLYVDNADAGYEEVAGAWTSAEGHNDAQVWGLDYRRAALTGGSEAVARWRPDVPEETLYNVFVRLPADQFDAAAFRVVLRVDGAAVDSTAFAEPPVPAEWTYAGTARFRPGADNVVEIAARGDGQAGRVLAADAVKLSAKVHDRRLSLSSAPLDFGEVIVEDTTAVALPVRNTGTGSITIDRVYSRSGTVAPGLALPIVLGPMEQMHLPLDLFATRQGEMQDTLVVESDDPVEPVKRVPFHVRVLDYFVTVDDLDGAYEETGAWSTSVTEAYGSRSRYAFVGAPSGTAAAFSGTAARTGVYAWSFLVPRTENAAVRARYVLFADEAVVDTLVVDQNFASGSWRTLGLYPLRAAEAFRVEVAWADRDQSGRVLRADAVRLFRVGADVREMVVDNDGAGYEEEGTWSTSISQASYGESSRYAPADGSGRAFFHARIERDGMHGLYEVTPTTVNSTVRAAYVVSRNGSPVDSVIVDQNEGSGAWRFLTAGWFAAGDEVTVEVAHRGAAEPGRVLRADAIRFVYGAETPTASEPAPAPGAFTLGPNYPNPVRGATTFDYALGRPADVRIRLFDVLGREVARLVDARLAPGPYSTRVDVSALPSGVYFCRMEADGFTATRTWIVVR